MKKLVLMAALAVSFVSYAEKQQCQPGAGARGGRSFARMRNQGSNNDMALWMMLARNAELAEKIGLSDEQKKKLEGLCSTRSDWKQSDKKIREAMKKQAELLEADVVDEAAVMAVIDEVWEMRKEMAKKQTRRVIEMKSVLTPEQVAEAKKFMKESFKSRMDRKKAPPRERMRRGRRGQQGGAPSAAPSAN